MIRYGETNRVETLLASAADEAQAIVIESILRANEIPVLRRYAGAGGYLSIYLGMTAFGIELYVPSSDFAYAKSLLAADANGQTDILSSFETHYRHKQRTRALIILIVMAPGVLAAILGAVYDLLVLFLKFAG